MAKRKKRRPTKKKATPKSTGQIEAKPTAYRGIQFRSRLEARWAVYLDFNPLIDYWEYEPRSFTLDDGSAYTPDFVIQMGTGLQCWVEVKPVIPTDDYLRLLASVVPKLPGCRGHYLLLCTGSFYRNAPPPNVFGLVPGITPTKESIDRCNEPLTSIPIFGHQKAYQTASGYRFDLPEKLPPFRQGGEKSPFDHWREWQEKEHTKGKGNKQ